MPAERSSVLVSPDGKMGNIMSVFCHVVGEYVFLIRHFHLDIIEICIFFVLFFLALPAHVSCVSSRFY